MKSLLACLLMLLIAAVAFSQPGPQDADVLPAGSETSYDRTKDVTTVRLMPVRLSGEKDKYYRLHMSPSFSYPGRVYVKTQFIDFELEKQTVSDFGRSPHLRADFSPQSLAGGRAPGNYSRRGFFRKVRQNYNDAG